MAVTVVSAPVDAYDGCPVDALAVGWGVPALEAWARIGSTSDRALELARSGAPVGTVVVADEQTAGRGRHGAGWVSARDAGVWLSIILDGAEPPRLPTLVVGVACARAVETVAPSLRVGLKWPNDLVVEGRKLGGVLSERAGARVVVGVGINLRAPPRGLPPRIADLATTLEVHGYKELQRNVLAGVLVQNVIADWAWPDASDAALRETRSRDVLRDRTVWTEQAGVGVARGIDDQGALVLERADGSRVQVVSGSVRVHAADREATEDFRGG